MTTNMRHNPIMCLTQSLGHDSDTRMDVVTRVRHEVQDLPNVLVTGRVVVVAHRLQNRDLHLSRHVARDLGYSYVGLVLHYPNRHPNHRQSHHKPQPYSLCGGLLEVLDPSENGLDWW